MRSLVATVRGRAEVAKAVTLMRTPNHFLNPCSSEGHVFAKAFVGVLGICMDTLMTLVVVLPFSCTLNPNKRSLEPDYASCYPLEIVDARGRSF